MARSACKRLLQDKQLRWQKGPEHSQKPEQHPGQADAEPGRGSPQQLLALALPAGCTSHRPAPTARGVDFPAFHSGSHLFIPALQITSKAQLNPCCRDINHLAWSRSSRSLGLLVLLLEAWVIHNLATGFFPYTLITQTGTFQPSSVHRSCLQRCSWVLL